MTEPRIFLLLTLTLLSVACGGEVADGSDESAAEAVLRKDGDARCKLLCERVVECLPDEPGDECREDCEDMVTAALDKSCALELLAYFDCGESLTCEDLQGTEDRCDEQDRVYERCVREIVDDSNPIDAGTSSIASSM